MADDVIRVKGLTELLTSLKMADAGLAKEIRGELRLLGTEVAVLAREKFTPFNAHSAQGFRPVVRTRGGVFVEQTLRKTTGAHPEWGALQMTAALLPALGETRPQIVLGFERMIDDLHANAGLIGRLHELT